MHDTSRKSTKRVALAIPAKLAEIPKLALKHRYSARNVVIAELALFHAFTASQISAMDVTDVDLKRLKIRRKGSLYWIPLITSNLPSWTELAQRSSEGPDKPFLLTRSGVRISRIDVWRVLRRLGGEAQLSVKLHTRRSRKWIGNALSRRNELTAELLQLIMGVSDLRAISQFLPVADLNDAPDHVAPRQKRT